MILVTGATGLLGSHLLYHLLASGKQVRAIRRSVNNIPEVRRVFGYYTDRPAELLDKVQWIKADILNYDDMLSSMEGIDEVYHCAAIVSFDPAERSRMIKNNRIGTANIVDAALEQKVKKLVHVSSTAALGQTKNGEPANERCLWGPSKNNTGYSISKFHSEMEVWRGIEQGLNAVIVNPSIILGPGFWQHGSSSIFTKIDHGLKFYSYGMTGYVGIWDVVRTMIYLMESGISGERYILSTENRSYKSIFDTTADALNRPRPSIEGTLFMSELAWRIDWVKSKVFRFGEHTFSRERVRAARNKVSFDNSKILAAVDFSFEPIDEVIKKTAKIYDADRK